MISGTIIDLWVNPRRAKQANPRFQAAFVGPESLPFAHLTVSVFMGSTLSHFTQRSWVLPVRSVIAMRSFLHFGQR
jgi:hypothetical protein